MMYEKTIKQTILGHSCEGGGATIENCPVHLHIHVHGGDQTLINKLLESSTPS